MTKGPRFLTISYRLRSCRALWRLDEPRVRQFLKSLDSHWKSVSRAWAAENMACAFQEISLSWKWMTSFRHSIKHLTKQGCSQELWVDGKRPGVLKWKTMNFCTLRKTFEWTNCQMAKNEMFQAIAERTKSLMNRICKTALIHRHSNDCSEMWLTESRVTLRTIRS